MATLKLIVGIVFALIALFAGGCALFFAAGSGMDEAIMVLGVLPAAVSGFIAWLCLRKPPAANEEP